MAYLSISEVRDRLRIDEAYAEADLERLITESEDIVTDYLKRDEPFTEANVPPRVKTATLLVLRSLFDTDNDPITEAVKSILHRTRGPTLA